MVRKLALAVALALGGASMTAQGLGLGEIKTRSALNQNFDADIALLSLPAEDLDGVRVRLAPNEVFERAGVERSFLLSRLRFEPEVTADGRTVIRVTSDFPIQEPYLNFLIEVNWSLGRVVKEYTVLLDPPTTTGRRAPRIAAPVAAPRQTIPAVTQRQPAPVAARPAAGGTVTEYGPVKPNETLWAIAREVRPAGVSMAQMMMALLDANPQAFLDNNINKLRRGQILRVPGRDEILALSRAQAQARYREQQDAWLAERDAVEQQASAAAAAATATEPQPELRIASARPSEDATEVGASEGTQGREPALQDLNTQVLLAREEAESSRQEAELLRERVEALRAQLEDMQRLLTLKDDQLARLQGTVADSLPGEVEEVAAEEIAVEPLATQPIEAETPEPVATEVPVPSTDIAVGEPVGAGEQIAAELGTEFSYVDKAPLRVVTEQSLEAELAAEPEIVAEPEVAAEPEILVEPESGVEPAVPAGPAAEEPAPVEAQVPVEPEPVVASVDAGGGFVPSLPMVVGGLAGVVILGGLLGLVMARRGSRGEPEPELAAAGAVAAAAPAGAQGKAAGDAEGVDSADLSDFASVDLDGLPDDEDVDPVSEADVYIAYGRYQQAEQLLRQAMEQKPERLALPHKLLEVYYATRNSSAFVTLAGEMMADGRDQADTKAWERVREMGRELDANNAMFTTVSGGAAAAAAAATGVAAAAAPPPQQADDGLGLDDLDLSELARDLEEEVDDAKASAAIEDPEPLSVDLEEAISQLEAEVEEEERASALNDLESLDLELPSIEAAGPEQNEQEVISLDELNQASSIGDDSENLASQLRAEEDDGLGTDSVLTIDTDIEATELEQLTELSTLDVGTEDEAAAAAASGGDELNLEAGFDHEIQSEEAETAEIFDSGTTSAIGQDEVQTKLDLARAYVEMGDSEGAKSILEEVQEEGSDQQREEAGEILQRLAS